MMRGIAVLCAVVISAALLPDRVSSIPLSCSTDVVQGNLSISTAGVYTAVGCGTVASPIWILVKTADVSLHIDRVVALGVIVSSSKNVVLIITNSVLHAPVTLDASSWANISVTLDWVRMSFSGSSNRAFAIRRTAGITSLGSDVSATITNSVFDFRTFGEAYMGLFSPIVVDGLRVLIENVTVAFYWANVTDSDVVSWTLNPDGGAMSSVRLVDCNTVLNTVIVIRNVTAYIEASVVVRVVDITGSTNLHQYPTTISLLMERVRAEVRLGGPRISVVDNDNSFPNTGSRGVSLFNTQHAGALKVRIVDSTLHATYWPQRTPQKSIPFVTDKVTCIAFGSMNTTNVSLSISAVSVQCLLPADAGTPMGLFGQIVMGIVSLAGVGNNFAVVLNGTQVRASIYTPLCNMTSHRHITVSSTSGVSIETSALVLTTTIATVLLFSCGNMSVDLSNTSVEVANDFISLRGASCYLPDEASRLFFGAVGGPPIAMQSQYVTLVASVVVTAPGGTDEAFSIFVDASTRSRAAAFMDSSAVPNSTVACPNITVDISDVVLVVPSTMRPDPPVKGSTRNVIVSLLLLTAVELDHFHATVSCRKQVSLSLGFFSLLSVFNVSVGLDVEASFYISASSAAKLPSSSAKAAAWSAPNAVSLVALLAATAADVAGVSGGSSRIQRVFRLIIQDSRMPTAASDSSPSTTSLNPLTGANSFIFVNRSLVALRVALKGISFTTVSPPSLHLGQANPSPSSATLGPLIALQSLADWLPSSSTNIVTLSCVVRNGVEISPRDIWAPRAILALPGISQTYEYHDCPLPATATPQIPIPLIRTVPKGVPSAVAVIVAVSYALPQMAVSIASLQRSMNALSLARRCAELQAAADAGSSSSDVPDDFMADAMSNPLQLHLSAAAAGEGLGWAAGSVIGNIVLMVVLTIAAWLWASAKLARRSEWALTMHEALRRGFAACGGWISSYRGAYIPLLQPLVTAAAALAIAPMESGFLGTPLGYILATVAVIVVFCPTLSWAWVVLCVWTQSNIVFPFVQVCAKKSPFSVLDRRRGGISVGNPMVMKKMPSEGDTPFVVKMWMGLERVLNSCLGHPSLVWRPLQKKTVPKNSKSGSNTVVIRPVDAEPYLPAFEELRAPVRWYFVADFVFTTLSGVVTGVASFTDHCEWGEWLLVALSLINVVVVLLLRPYCSRFSNSFAVANLALSCVVAFCAVLASDNNAATVITMVLMVLTLLPPVASCVVAALSPPQFDVAEPDDEVDKENHIKMRNQTSKKKTLRHDDKPMVSIALENEHDNDLAALLRLDLTVAEKLKLLVRMACRVARRNKDM